MIGFAVEGEGEAALACYRVNYSEGEIQAFEDWALFDVELEAGGGVRAELRGGELRGVETESADGFENLRRGFESSGERAAADERFAEADTFFFGEADDFDGQGCGIKSDCFNKSYTKDYSEDAVEGAGIGDCVEV